MALEFHVFSSYFLEIGYTYLDINIKISLNNAVNKWISELIASATEKMMKQKDERCKYVPVIPAVMNFANAFEILISLIIIN